MNTTAFASKSEQRRFTSSLRDLRAMYMEHAREALNAGYTVRAQHLVASARLANRQIVRAKLRGAA